MRDLRASACRDDLFDCWRAGKMRRPVRRKSVPHCDYRFMTATHWRMRAEEMRALAEEAQDSTVRAMMLRIATNYDWRAESAADRAASKNSIMFRVMSADDKVSDGVGHLDRAPRNGQMPTLPGRPLGMREPS